MFTFITFLLTSLSIFAQSGNAVPWIVLDTINLNEYSIRLPIPKHDGGYEFTELEFGVLHPR